MDITYRFDPYRPLVSRRPRTAKEALALLHAGNAQFVALNERLLAWVLGDRPADDVTVVPSSLLDRRLSLVRGEAPPQQPFAIVLSCSDSRVPVEELFQVHANSLFVVRVAGNTLGTEILGSIAYALSHFADSLKLLVVLGHSACGAITAAVDSHLRKDSIGRLGSHDALRSLVDRLRLPVRMASQAQSCRAAANGRLRRRSLIESASYVNAAVTAYELARQFNLAADGPLKAVHGVFDLAALCVQSLPNQQPAGSPAEFLAEEPQTAAELLDWSRTISAALRKPTDVCSMTDRLLPALV
jgi:carbonic anhydrase